MNFDSATLMSFFFAAVMIVPIAPGAMWYRNRSLRGVSPADRERIVNSLRRDSRRIWIAWSCALLFFVVWFWVEAFAEISPGLVLPFKVAVLILFHATFWPFVMPMCIRLDRHLSELDIGQAPAATSVRTARLTPRRLDDYLPKYWKKLTGAIALSGAFVLAAALLKIGVVETRLVLMAIGFALTGLLSLLAWAIAMRMEVTSALTYGCFTPEDAESLRQFRVRGFFWMLVATSVAFFACTLGCVEVGRGTITEPNLGIIGGVVGSLIGLAGAIYGTAVSLKANGLRTASSRRDSAT